MINKYAEIQDRILLYNACKGVLRVKIAAGMPGGAVSSMNANAGTGQQQQASGQPQKPMSRWEFSKTYGNAPIEDSWTDWLPFSGGKARRQYNANNEEYNKYVKQMQSQNRQMLNQGQQPMQQQPMQQQPMQQQQPAPQGVDPNQWQQFQRFQQMIQQFPAS